MRNYFDKSESKRHHSEESQTKRTHSDRFNREDSTINRPRKAKAQEIATPTDFAGQSFMKDRRNRESSSFTPREERSPRISESKSRSPRYNNRDEQSNERRHSNTFGNRYNSDDRNQRHSFNPNFDSNNRPKFNRNENGDTRPNRNFNRTEESFDNRRRFSKDNREFSHQRPESRGGRFNDHKEPNNKRFRKNGARNIAEYPSYESAKNMPETMRLNRFISMSGICSRREADELISQGLITVNGVIITELGAKIKSTDEVIYNGQRLKGEKKVYILMNKPKGYVTTLEDPNADKTVISLIGDVCKERIYPVGRLDKNSLGVLLITNDGDLTKKLTHPSYNKKKIYQVDLNKNVSVDDLQKIYNGIELEDGLVEVDDIQYIDETKKKIGIEIHSGRNRVVRRLFESLGYSVVKLDRVYFAGLTKKNLPRGRWRFLTDAEVSMLKNGSYE
jgi:23S rRNA pseudouridine2605 synthase